MAEFKNVVVGLLLAMTIGVADAADASGPAGAWKWSVTSRGKSVDVNLELTHTDGKLEGTIKGPKNSKKQIDDAVFKDGQVSFTVTREPTNGAKVTAKYKGTLKGDSIKGIVEIDNNGKTQSRDWVARRQSQK